MKNESKHIAEWTFISKGNIPEDLPAKLTPGEEAICAYKTVKDVAVFTNKRLLVKDAEGLTGKKKYSLPYSSILMFYTENGGVMDIESDIEMWTSAGSVKINLSRSIDVREIDRLLAAHIL